MQKLLKSVTSCLWCCAVASFFFSSEVLAQPADGAKQRQEEIQQSREKLNTIRLALAKDLPNEFVKKAYPAGYSDQDGKLILSWRVAILPALGEEELWKQFRLDQPWDSEHNRKLIPKMPAVFKAVRGESKEGHTYYRGFAGEDAMFPLKSPTAEKVPAGDRSYFPVFCRPFVKTSDGTSNTFLIAEAGETVPWTKPEELVYDAKQPLPKLGGQFDGDFVAMSSDGTTRLMTRSIPEPALRAAITAARGENIQFKAAAESGFTIEFVTPEMEERKYALGRLAEKSPRGSMTQITDATNETALAGIVAEGRAVPWTKPDDLIFDDTFQTKENAFAEGAIMFANGSVRYVHLQEGLDRKQFRALFTIDGKEPSPLASLYPPGHTLIQPTYATVQETVRHAEARSQNLKNLRHMALAFHNYQDSTKSLPPAIVYGPDGKPWHSWRVVMLPYLGYGALYQEYDGTVPWDHPKNAAVLNKMPEVFRDPLSDKSDSNKTRYLLATGAGAAFPTKPSANVAATQPATTQPTATQLAANQPPAITFKGHTAFAQSVAFSPDGKRLATASADQTVKVWDAASGKELLTVKGHAGEVMSVTFSPNGKWLATASHDQTVKVWDTESGLESLTLKGHTAIVTSIAYSADGKRLASASYDQTVRLWDAATGRLIRTFNGHTLAVMGVAFSPDGKWLASAASDLSVKVWDVVNGLAKHTMKGHGKSVTSVAFSPDGKTLATGSQDQTVKIWDVTNGKEKLTLTGHTGGVSSVVFRPDGKRLLSASGGQQPAVHEWDSTSGQVTGKLLGHAAAVRSVAFSPDGKRFATATGHVQHLGEVKVWDVAFLTANPAPLQQPTSSLPAPPKPVAKDGREPIEYQPLNPAAWKAKNQSTWLFPWEGERVVLLTTTADFDPKTMAVFLKRLDAAWKRCGELVGESPWLFRQHKGKVTIVAVADPSLTFDISGGYGFSGGSGVEVATFYGPQGDYERVRKDPDQFPDRYVYLMAMNHSMVMNRIIIASMGSATLLRHLGLDGVKPSESETQARQAVERFENVFAQSNATFAESFNYFGARIPRSWNDIDGKPYPANDLGLLFASIMLKLRQENGGDEWIKKFYRHLHECPPIVGQAMTEPHVVNAQLVNWVIAASLASGKDLLPLFRDRWRFPLPPEIWQALQKVDWKKPRLTADNVVDALPMEHLPLNVVMSRPSFLTPERRKQNLLVGGTFEDDAASKWKVASWRNNNEPNGVIESGVVKEGQKAAVIRNTISDDVHFDQLVTVKPGTRYLLSGWIKTKDVVIEAGQQYGQVGANIGIGAGYEHTRSMIVGTTDWGYVTLIFDSGTRTEVMTFARLGYANSIAKGEAWFDDLSLIPIGETPVRPTAPAPPATITTNKDWKGWPKDAPPPAIAPFNAAQAKQHQEAWAKHLGVPVEYTNSIGMKFRLIPPGEFLMGSTAKELGETFQSVTAEELQSEAPQHKVALTEAFYLGVHEVTQQQYQAVVNLDPSYFTRTGGGKAAIGDIETSDLPVDSVSWQDAMQFCTQLSEREKLAPFDLRSREIKPNVGLGYRLPTEAQWEFACRAGTQTRYWTGDSDIEVRRAGVFTSRATRKVGQLAANPFGLFDVHGNVWEWCLDGWNPSAYLAFRDEIAVDPLTPWNQASNRVVGRGAHFYYGPGNGRSARRGNAPQTLRYLDNGFRAALSVAGVKAALANPVKAEAEPEDNQNAASTWKGWPKDAPAPAIAPFNTEQAKQHQEAWAKHLGVPVEYTNSIGMKFQLIPPGEFEMGSTSEEVATFAAEIKTRNIPGWYFEKIPCEAPKHRVRITKAFYLGLNEVTQAEYERLMGHNPSRFKGDPNRPVEMVSWNEASAFYRRLRDLPDEQKSQAVYRLPSEAEWEYACRAGTTTAWYATDDEKDLKDQAWYLANDGGTTHPVRHKKPNAWGLYDLHGNVWEHCEDWFGDRYYATSPLNDPLGPPLSGASRMSRVARGGADDAGGSFTCRAAARIWNDLDRHVMSLGFRLAMSVKPADKGAANPVQAEAPPVAISGKELRRFEGHRGTVAKAVFSADGKRVLSGSGYPNGDRAMRLWDVETGREIRQFSGDGMSWVFGVSLSPDGKLALSGCWNGLRLWDVETGQLRHHLKFDGPTKQIIGVTFSHDGKLALSGGGDGVVRLWDVNSGVQLREFTGHTGQAMLVEFSPDDRQIVSSGHGDKTVRLWNTETGKELLRLEGHTAGVESVTFARDGTQLISASVDELIVWDAKDGKLIRKIAGDGSGFLEAVFFPDGRRVLLGTRSGRVSIWDSVTGQELRRLAEGSEWVWTVAVSPDGQHALSAGGSNMINGQWVTGKDFAIHLWTLADNSTSAKESDVTPRPDENKKRTTADQVWRGWPKDVPPPAIAPFDAAQAKQHQEGWAKHLGVPVEFTNSIGMKFVLVPPGEFLMGNTSERIEAELKSAGSNPAWQASMRSQAPQHKVILTQPIYLGAHEVTQGHYETVTGNKPSHFAATGAGREAVNGLETTQHPVDSVSWLDVAEFCAKLSEREKLKPFDFRSSATATPQRDSGYRLPTEAEWERACRAGTVTTFWPGNIDAELLRAGWFEPNSKKRTHAVGELRANPFGLHDVHGNVWEWVLDEVDLNYYQQFEKEPAVDPTGPTPTNTRRGLRGGSWQYISRDCWASYRHSQIPSFRHRNIGFRLALSVAAVKSALANPAQVANANARQKEAEGDKHREQMEYAQAIACYREVVQHEPNNAAMLNRLAWVLAVSPQKDQPASEALKFAQRAIQQQPSNPLYRNSLGAAQYRAGQYAEALSNLAVVVEAPPKNFAWLMHNLLFQALCHERLGDRATAQTVYFAALELLKQPSGDSSRVHEARLLQSEIAELGVLERVPELFTLKGHTNLVLSVAFSPDGKIIASGSADRTLKLWDAASGQELRTLKGDLSTVTRNAFSPDSKTLAAPGLKGDSGPGDVTLWDVATGTKKGTWKGHLNQVWAVAFSPDGKQLASSSIDGMVKLWDAAKGQEIRSWQAHSDYVLWVAFSPDGKRLATGAEGRDGKYLKMWDITTGQEQLVLKGHTATNGGVAFSPDGKRVVSGSSDKTVKLWDSSSGQELRTLNGHTGQVGGVLFSPDGKWIASACYDGTAKLWDAATGHEIRTLRSQRGGVSSVAISPDGKRLVTGNSDQTVRVWDISGVKPIPVRSGDPPSNPQPTIKPVTISGAPVSLTLQSPACGFSSVAFSADGQQLVTSSLDQTVRVWDSVIGEEKLSLKGGSCATLSRDGKWLASGGSDKVLRVWDASNGQEKLALKGHTDNISGVAFSLDGQRVASASDDQTVKIWEVASGKESLTLKGHSDAVRCVAFSPDGKRLASAGRDQIVKLWDATSGEEQLALSGHKAAITSIAFSPDGTSLASASHDQSVKLWNLPNGKVIRTLEGHDSGVMSVSFSADGKRLVSASGDQTVRMWDSATGQPLLTLKGHASQVVGAALSPDGNRIASASFDRTAKVWELAAIPKKSSQPWKTLEAVRREYSHADKDYLAAARDSRSLINGDFGDGLKEWLTEGGAKDFQVVKQGTQATLTTAGPQQVADTGRLYQYFKVPDEAVELQFKLHGGADSEQTHVALWHGTELKHRVSGRNDNSSFQVSWNVMSLRGDIVSLEIVDHSLSDWGFIGVQGFKLVSQKAPVTPANDPKSKPLTVDPNQVPLTLKGHSQQVTDVAFNADGTRIATASQDGTVKLWDAVTGQVTHTLKSSASRLAFSPDGKRLATGGHENGVTLWDVSTGQIALRLSGLQPAILGVAFAPDGQRLAAGSADGTLKVWDITNGQERLTLKTPAWQVAFSPDGKQLASASHADSAVKVWDATNGQELFSLKLSQGGVNSLMFSPDGKRLATSGYPSGPTVWDLSTGQPVLTLKAAPWSIAFDPTGQWIATGHDDNGVLLSNAATGQTLATLKGNTQRGSCVAFSVDGKRLASASDDLTVKVWDLVPGASPPGSPPRKKPAAIPTLNAGDELLTLKGHGGDVESVVFSADGKRLVTASEDQTAKIWNATDGSELLTLKGHTGPVTCVAITADGKQVATGGRDHLAKLWDATTGRETHSLTAGTNYLTSVAFSPDGKRLASAAILAAKVWNTTTGQEAFDMQGHFANVNAIVFSPDEKRLASCSHDMTVKLRDATNGRETLTLKGHRDAVTGVAFSPDGKRVVSCSHDQTLKVWDTKTGSELLTLIGHTSYITGVAISTDGKRLASVSWDSTARLWDAESGQELLTVKGHSHRVNGVAFSPDGKRLATASDDRTVKLWDISLSSNDNKKSAASRPMPPKEAERPVTFSAETARVTQATQDDPLTVTLKGHAEAITSLAISPDGKWLASASSDGVVVWDVADRKPRFTLRAHARYAISSVAISPDGKRLAAGVEMVAKIWDAATGTELQSLAGNTGRVNGIAFSSDGQRIASATQDQTVTIWDSTNGKVIDSLKEKLQSFGAIAFSPDGQWMAVGTLSGDTTGKVRKATSLEESFGLYGHNLYIKSFAFSADGKRLVSASDDGSLKIWETQTGDDLLTLRDRRVPKSPAEARAHHSNQMKGVALSPDGRRLVSAGSNGFVSVWDAATGQKLLSLEGHQGEVRSVVFSPDGKWVASAGADATVKVWTLADRPTLPPDGTILKANVDPKKVEADLKALEGTWQITDYATSANQPLPPEVAASIKEQRVVFQGDVLTFASKGRSESMVIIIDPTQPLKAIDLSSFDQGDSFPSMLGVYSLAGDTLKLAMSSIEAVRPKELKPGDGILSVMTLTRTKSSDVQPTDGFNFHTWRPAAKNLQRMNVKAKLANRESIRVGQLDRGFGLPETIFRWGVIGLPPMTNDAGIPETMWKEIASISHIVVVTPAVNDAMLKQLSQHRGLITLYVTGTWSASAASIAELKKCPHLMGIVLEGSTETAEIVSKLTALNNLRDLTILNATATQELVTAITQFKELESLSLHDAGVTDDLVEQLATLKNLKFLVLQQARAADKDKPKLSDKGLRSLMSLKDLKWLDLQGHTFSAAAVADFEKSLPNCRVLKSVTTNSPKNDTKF